MKYVIDLEKIEGTNLYKAKEFNTLVFDRNGLMKIISLEDELGYYYCELRNDIYYKGRKIDKLEHSNKSLKGMLKKEGELLSKAVKDKKELEEKIISLIDDNEDLVERCIELQNENEENVPIEEVVNADKEMTNQFEHSEREYERLTHTIKSQKRMLNEQTEENRKLRKENRELKSRIKELEMKSYE